MKVAVSIPDAVFADAETLAKRFNTSRSDLYSQALNEFIGQHLPDHVTEAMNAVVDVVGAEADAFSAKAARRVFESIEW